jgi:hypothetical protein
MATYSVQILEMSRYQDPEGEWQVPGFPTLELAREFARRWVRDSVEELRSAGQTREELRRLWHSFGDDALVLGGNYAGYSELDFFIDHPASSEERDWAAIKKQAGVK